jgi:uncharacterized protein YgiM (DUF1202 family)
MMGFLVGIFVIVVILGALFGARSFGGTVKRGCGILFLIASIGTLLLLFLISSSNTADEPQEVVYTEDSSTTFVVDKSCVLYSKPNIKSDSVGVTKGGDTYEVEDADRYKYFYKLSYDHGSTFYVRKECLRRE